MARVTVEDCVLSVPNRFELCLIASKRARNIISGAHTELSQSKEKPTVIALREIGENLIDVQAVREDILLSIKNRDSYSTANAQATSATEDVMESITQESTTLDQSGANFVSENLEIED